VYRSDPLRSVHLAVKGLEKAGLVDKITLRRFDVACLALPELGPGDVRRIREAAQMSQAVFAMALNVNVSLVSQWERGEKKVRGPALRLLHVVDRKGVAAIL